MEWCQRTSWEGSSQEANRLDDQQPVHSGCARQKVSRDTQTCPVDRWQSQGMSGLSSEAQIADPERIPETLTTGWTLRNDRISLL